LILAEGAFNWIGELKREAHQEPKREYTT